MMIPAILALLSGLSNALIRGVIKQSFIDNFLMMSGYVVTACFALVWLLSSGVVNVAGIFWIYVIIHAMLLFGAVFITIEAHRASPLNLTIPYLSLTPLILLVFSPFLGMGQVTALGGLGIFLVVIGLYVLHSGGENNNILTPLRAFMSERGSRLMAVTAVIYALTSILDLYAVQVASPAFYLAIDLFLVGTISFIVFCVRSVLKGKKFQEITTDISKGFKSLLLFGLLNVVVGVGYLSALALTQHASYIVAIKTGSTMVFTVLYGLWASAYVKNGSLYKNETQNISYRIASLLILVCGVILIIVYGKI